MNVSGNFNKLKFKNSDGYFNEILTNNTKGILSFYEATHLRLHGEDILEGSTDQVLSG